MTSKRNSIKPSSTPPQIILIIPKYQSLPIHFNSTSSRPSFNPSFELLPNKMAPITLFVAMLATASSAFGYTFTTCNAGCTGTGCGGEATSWTLGPASTQNIPGTQCIIWPSGGEAGSWDVCNRANGGGSCTSGSNLNCFDAEDSSGRKICNTAGTQFIGIKA